MYLPLVVGRQLYRQQRGSKNRQKKASLTGGPAKVFNLKKKKEERERAIKGAECQPDPIVDHLRPMVEPHQRTKFSSGDHWRLLAPLLPKCE